MKFSIYEDDQYGSDFTPFGYIIALVGYSGFFILIGVGVALLKFGYVNFYFLLYLSLISIISVFLGLELG